MKGFRGQGLWGLEISGAYRVSTLTLAQGRLAGVGV